jgi:hypothetical protein
MNADRPRDWDEARQNTVDLWLEVKRSLAEPDELRLLTDINAVCGLCQRAKVDLEQAATAGRAAAGETKCDYCPFFDQFGGCRAVNRRMTDCVLDKDWDLMGRLVDEFVDRVKALEVPRGWRGSHSS